ncbi:MAG TPA: DALR anticodon-binding domain-containing protein, partial [Chloroflexota bacterium]|nr:DALR anticodon-binding domain-containing protein [Chloroflexota bacterium]
GLAPGPFQPPAADAERTVMLLLTGLPDALQLAYDTRMPNHLADYVYALSNEFNRFYNTCHILREEDTAVQASWLALTHLFRRVMELVLHLLGIEIPERM